MASLFCLGFCTGFFSFCIDRFCVHDPALEQDTVGAPGLFLFLTVCYDTSYRKKRIKTKDMMMKRMTGGR